MGEIIPTESKRQPTPPRVDPHASVTLPPPAPDRPTPFPSFTRQSDAHFRAALDAGSRAGSSLTELSKIVAELSGGLSGAKLANEQLVQELETLRALLGAANEQQLAHKQRVAQLERALAEAQEGAQRERRFLTDQHDEFLAALMEEHEEALSRRGEEPPQTSPETAELTQQLVRAEAARALAESEREQAEVARFAIESELSRAHEALSRAQQLRAEAEARAEKRERERDELRAEASQLRARLGTNRPSTVPPPPVAPSGKLPSFASASALTLDDSELDSNLHPRAVTPRVPSVVPRFGGALAPERRSSPSSSPDATVTPFPRETTRPGVGGPKPPPPSFGPPPSGWTPPPPPAAEPTPSVPRFQSAANLPQGLPSLTPVLKHKPDPTTRPLIDYSLGEGGVQSELLEGARLSSKPPRK